MQRANIDSITPPTRQQRRDRSLGPVTLSSSPRSAVCSTAYTHTRTHYDGRIVFGALVAGLGLRPPATQECELLHRIARCQRPYLAACPLLPPADQMKPQQQLSQIEKSVTHLLVATKQLLGSSHAPSHPPPCPTDAAQKH